MNMTDTSRTTTAYTDAETPPRDVYLGFLYSFKSIGRGKVGYLLTVPEFKKRIGEFVLAGNTVTEQVLVDILKGIVSDAKNGVIKKENVPVGAMNNVVNRLERSIAAKVSE